MENQQMSLPPSTVQISLIYGFPLSGYYGLYSPPVHPLQLYYILAETSQATPELVKEAIDSALRAKEEWQQLPFAARAAVFLKAADQASGKYRYQVMAATMLGQGKKYLANRN